MVPQEDAGRHTLVDIIVAQVFEALAQHNAFDAKTIARLHNLAKSGGLAKYEQVVSALSTEGGK